MTKTFKLSAMVASCLLLGGVTIAQAEGPSQAATNSSNAANSANNGKPMNADGSSADGTVMPPAQNNQQ